MEEWFRKKLGLLELFVHYNGGRITLIRCTLSSLHICYMSTFQLLNIVRSSLDQLQRHFLRGDARLEKKPYLVKCTIVFLDRESRGLEGRTLDV